MKIRRVAAVLLATLLFSTCVAGIPTAVAAPSPQINFSQAQQDFMCTLCGEALNIARAPQAYSENQTLRQLIAKGLTEDQIKRAMVADYGAAVLAKPPARGFNLLVYIIPAAVVVVGLSVVGFTIPRWRRKSQAAASHPLPTQPKLSDEDTERLDADLAQRI